MVTSTLLPKQGAEPALLSVTADEGQGQLSHSHDPGGPALPLAIDGEGQEQGGRHLSLSCHCPGSFALSWVLQQVTGRVLLLS